MLKENILHKLSEGRREIGDSWFLRDFCDRILSSRRAMSWSMILRIKSSGSPLAVEPEVLLVSSGKNTIQVGFLRLIFFLKKRKKY